MRPYIYYETAEHHADQYERILKALMVQLGWSSMDAQVAILSFDECRSSEGQVLHRICQSDDGKCSRRQGRAVKRPGTAQSVTCIRRWRLTWAARI